MNNCGKILWHQKTFVSHKFSRIELHLIKLQAMTDNFNNGNSHSRRISEHNTSQKMLNPATENATTATVLLHVIRKLGSTKKQSLYALEIPEGSTFIFGDTRISIQYSVGSVKGNLHARKSSPSIKPF